MIEPTILTNSWIVTPDKLFSGSVEMLGEHIVAVYRGRTNLRGALDMEGDYLIPGLVDLHSSNLNRHLTANTGVRWPAMAAVLAHDADMISAGITTAYSVLAIDDDTLSSSMIDVDEIMAAMRKAVDHRLTRCCHKVHVWFGASRSPTAELLDRVAPNPLLGLVTVASEMPGQSGLAEPAPLPSPHAASAGDRGGNILVSPPAAEHRPAPDTGAMLRAPCHEWRVPIARPDSGSAVLPAAWEGASAGICAFPTSEATARKARIAGMKVLVGAPRIVFEASMFDEAAPSRLAANGLLDILCSDYHPSSLMQAVFALHRAPIHMPLPEAVATASLAPSEAGRIGDRGTIAPGKRADLARVRAINGIPTVREVWRNGCRVFSATG